MDESTYTLKLIQQARIANLEHAITVLEDVYNRDLDHNEFPAVLSYVKHAMEMTDDDIGFLIGVKKSSVSNWRTGKSLPKLYSRIGMVRMLLDHVRMKLDQMSNS